MATLRTTVRIEASPDDVWRVLGDLAGVAAWIPGVTSARMEGSIRRCTTADGGEIVEEISDVSPQDRRYRYAYLSTPLPVRDAYGTFTVTADGTGSVVALDAHFEAVDPARADDVVRMLEGAYRDALASLQALVVAAAG